MLFLKFPYFFYDPVDVDNLISGSSVFLKSSLYICKFSFHVLLKPSLKDFEHNLANVKSVQLNDNLEILWHCPSLGLEWKLTFSSPVATAQFSKFAGILSAALEQHHVRIWNRSAGIPSSPLALSTVVLLKAHFTSHSRMSGSIWLTTPSWLLE